MAIHLGRPLPDASRDRPGRRRENTACRPSAPKVGTTGVPSLFGLAPGGVYRAAAVTGDAVRSYRTLSTLPATLESVAAGGLLSVALSLGSPPPGVTRHRVPVEPGLSSPVAGASRQTKAAIRPSGTFMVEMMAPFAKKPLRPMAPRFAGTPDRRRRLSCPADSAAAASCATFSFHIGGGRARWGAAGAGLHR